MPSNRPAERLRDIVVAIDIIDEYVAGYRLPALRAACLAALAKLGH